MNVVIIPIIAWIIIRNTAFSLRFFCNTGFVSNVTVQNVYFSNTQNVARIKTWQGGTGYVRNISYNGIGIVFPINLLITDQKTVSSCNNGWLLLVVCNISYYNSTTGCQTFMTKKKCNFICAWKFLSSCTWYSWDCFDRSILLPSQVSWYWSLLSWMIFS